MARGNGRKRTREDGTTAYQVQAQFPPDPETAAPLPHHHLREGVRGRYVVDRTGRQLWPRSSVYSFSIDA